MDNVAVRGTAVPGGTDTPGGTAGSGGTGSPHGAGAALREDLLDLLRRREVRQRMNEALLREATGEAKSTGVIRAYELVQKILQDAGEDTPVEELDLRRFRDRDLRRMIARIRRTAAEVPAAELAGDTEEAETAAGGHTPFRKPAGDSTAVSGKLTEAWDGTAVSGKSTEASDSTAVSGKSTEAGDSYGHTGPA